MAGIPTWSSINDKKYLMLTAKRLSGNSLESTILAFSKEMPLAGAAFFFFVGMVITSFYHDPVNRPRGHPGIIGGYDVIFA